MSATYPERLLEARYKYKGVSAGGGGAEAIAAYILEAMQDDETLEPEFAHLGDWVTQCGLRHSSGLAEKYRSFGGYFQNPWGDYSCIRSTRAGRAANGRHAKARPDSRVAPAPAVMMVSAEIRSN